MMLVWILLTLAAGYIIGAEPHLKNHRAWLAERWAFFRELVRCLPCCCAWPGAVMEAGLRTGEFVPAWIVPLVPRWVPLMMSPILAFFCAMAIGFVLELLSPLTAVAKQGRMKGGKE